MKKLYFLILLFVSLLSKIADAQDPNFSQFYYHEVYYNPAFTGINNGLRCVLTDRQFWTAVPGTFRSSYLSAEYYDQKILWGSGVSLNFQNWAKGENFLMSNKIGLTYAKRINLNGVQFQIGIDPGFTFNRIDYSKLIFPDELDPRLGRIYETEFIPGQNKKSYFDIGIGTVCRFNIMQTSTKAIATNNIGISFHHLNQPDEGFLANSDDRLPMKMNIHWYSFFKISRNGFYNSHFYVAPGILFEKQKLRENFFKQNESCFKTLSFGANAIIPSRLSFMSQLYTGVWFRKQFYKSVALSDVASDIKSKQFDAVILTVGFIKYSRDGKQNFRVLYSYDLTVSNATFRTGGTHEIILAFEIHDLAIPGGKRSWEYVKNPADRFFHMGTGR